MDPVSHVALGYTLLNLRQGTERGVVAAVCLGALSPDIDVVLIPAGWDRYVVAHQGGTHSVIGAIICGVLAATLTRALRRGSSFAVVALAAVTGALSHVWFDLLSGASIAIWWPASEGPTSNLGVFAMADPVTASLVVVSAALVWHARESRRRRAVLLLGLFTLFIAGKAAARLTAESLFASVRGRPAERVEAAWGSVTRWHLYSRTPRSLQRWDIDIAACSVHREIEVTLLDKDAGAARLAAASLEWETVRNFRRSHDLTFSTVTNSERSTGGWRVMWSDLRYCGVDPANSLRCSVRVGGEIAPNELRPRLVVEVGQFVQTR